MYTAIIRQGIKGLKKVIPAYAQAGMSLCWLHIHIPHYGKYHVAARITFKARKSGKVRGGQVENCFLFVQCVYLILLTYLALHKWHSGYSPCTRLYKGTSIHHPQPCDIPDLVLRYHSLHVNKCRLSLLKQNTQYCQILSSQWYITKSTSFFTLEDGYFREHLVKIYIR